MNVMVVVYTGLNAVRFYFGMALLLVGAPLHTYAAAREDLLAQLPARIAQAERSDFASGTVNGRRYVALRFNAGDDTPERFKPTLLIARSTRTGYAYVAHFELEGLLDFDAWFARDSIFLRSTTAHHGVSSRRYQFGQREGRFRLVGIEDQSDALVPYGASALWATSSANLVTQTAVYRAQLYDTNDEAALKAATRRFSAGLPPIGGKVQSVNLSGQAVIQVPLEDFEPYLFRADYLCHYFDHHLKFHDGCRKSGK